MNIALNYISAPSLAPDKTRPCQGSCMAVQLLEVHPGTTAPSPHPPCAVCPTLDFLLRLLLPRCCSPYKPKLLIPSNLHGGGILCCAKEVVDLLLQFHLLSSSTTHHSRHSAPWSRLDRLRVSLVRPGDSGDHNIHPLPSTIAVENSFRAYVH